MVKTFVDPKIIKTSQYNWDQYYLDIAEVVRQKSKDPSSKIGAVLVGPENAIISTGFNGFPRGIAEHDPARWERPLKYDFVEHAERNAIYNAAMRGVKVAGSTLYLIGFGPPTVPCKDCTKAVIQAGVVRVVGRPYKEAPENWKESLEFSFALLREAEVHFKDYATS